MDEDDFDAIMDRLNELQEEALDNRSDRRGPNDEPTPMSRYFLGKDCGIAEAKTVIRERMGESGD